MYVRVFRAGENVEGLLFAGNVARLFVAMFDPKSGVFHAFDGVVRSFSFLQSNGVARMLEDRCSWLFKASSVFSSFGRRLSC